MNLKSAGSILATIALVASFGASANAECSAVPFGTISAAPSQIWQPKGGMRDVFIEGRFVQPEGCSYRFARINIFDEYGRNNVSAFIAIDPNGQFQRTLQLDTDRIGKDRDGRHYRVNVSAVNEAGTGAADVELVILHHPFNNH